jgi:hypothetical protein
LDYAESARTSEKAPNNRRDEDPKWVCSTRIV